MKRLDPVEAWLSNVAYAHSDSKQTAHNYRYGFRMFCKFIGCTPQQILDEYEESTDRQFKRVIGNYIRVYIPFLMKKGYAVGTITTMLTPVKSFLKYNDLPIPFVPIAKCKVTYHNRDVTKHEIVEVMRISEPRNRAFYCVMAQSGLRPVTLCSLRLKHLEPDLSKGISPCCIKVPEEITKGEYRAHFTFIGEESINHLKTYFKTRSILGPEDYVFAASGSDKSLSPKSISVLFARLVDKLKAQGVMKFDQVKGKPREVRLYNLRKFFRNQAAKAGGQYVNFWMGHNADYKAPHIPSSDDHYFSRENVEFQRGVYKELAMPHLRLESRTPSEMEQTIIELRQQLEELRRKTAILDDPLVLKALLDKLKKE